MGQGQARGDDDEDVLALERDIERLRRRGESLTSELIDRAQPSIRAVRTVVRVVRGDKKTLLKAVLLSPIVLGGFSLLMTGVLIGSMTQKARHRRRLAKTLPGRLLLALEDE